MGLKGKSLGRVMTAFGKYDWADDLVATHVKVPRAFLTGSDVEVSWNLHEFCLHHVGEGWPDYDVYYLCDNPVKLWVTSESLVNYLRATREAGVAWTPKAIPDRGPPTGKVRWFTIFAKYDSGTEFEAIPQAVEESKLGGTDEEMLRNLHELCLQIIGGQTPDFDFYYLCEGRANMVVTLDSLRAHSQRRKQDALAGGDEDSRLIELLVGPGEDEVFDIAVGG